MKTFTYLLLSVITLNNLNAAPHVTIIKGENTIFHPTEDGTPLCVAISIGDFEMVKKFSRIWVNVNEKSRDLTPLMLAVTYNRIEIIKYLIANGAKIEIKNDMEHTALKIAKFNHLNEASVLLQNGLKK